MSAASRSGVEAAAGAGGADGEAGEGGELGGEGLGRGDADLGAGERAQDAVGLAGHAALGDVDDRQRGVAVALEEAERGQGVGGLAGLGDQEAGLAGCQRRLAVAELRGDVPVDRQAGELFEPVLADEAGVGRGAAGDDGEARQGGGVERQLGQDDPVGLGVGEGAQRVAQHGRLLVDLLLHEVAVVALADQRPGEGGLDDRALGRAALGVDDPGTGAGQEGDVALLEVLDAAGERGQRHGVGAHEHLALAVADGERAALAGDDHQVLAALEQHGEREGALEAADGRERRLLGLHAPLDVEAHQVGDDLGVGLGGEAAALGLELGAELAEVLDDAVVDDGDAAADVGVGVDLGGRAVGGPAGVADAGGAGERLPLEAGREAVELALRAPALEGAASERGHARAVVAAVLEAAQGLEQQGCRRPLADHAHDTAHRSRLRLVPPHSACGRVNVPSSARR